LPSAVRGAADVVPGRLLRRWVARPEIRAFLRINAWEGVEWFHGESLDELVVWAGRLEAVLGGSATEASAVLDAITEAAAASGFRLDALMAAVAVPGDKEAEAAEAEAAEAAEAAAEAEPAPQAEPSPLAEPVPAKAPKPDKAGKKAKKAKSRKPGKAEKGR